ncbi:MAG: DNA repair protein RecN [Lentisphaerota bacterium]
MLKALRVKNLALVENIRVEFQPGLNVITGETGAGKSILIGALSLLMGDRADKKLIRAGQETCGAEALFELADSEAVDEVLEEYGLDPCEDGQLVIRRLVKDSGSGQILINDSPVTLQVLKRIGDLLVDLCGPHDHQSLLSPEFQLDLLDAFGHLWDERSAYEKLHEQYRELLARRDELAGSGEGIAEQIDLLKYRVQEIEEAAPVEGEEEKIQQEHQVVGNAQRVLELGGQIVQALQEGDESAFNALAVAQKALEDLARLMPEAAGWREEIRLLATQLQEVSTTLHSALERIDCDPSRLAWLDERLAIYQRLKKKYAPGVPEVLAILENSREKLRDLETRGERLSALAIEMERLEKQMRAHGGALSKKRKEVAIHLAEAVTRELRALGFAHGAFSVEVMDSEPQGSGMNQVEFGFAPNAGEPMSPLRAIASSGEISRVMLATKVVLARHDRIPVLVFDEIDSNVGGEMGNAVGRKLAEVAANHQVLCVTHLPQVAACGSSHLAVTKSVHDGRTFTEVKALAPGQRAEEIARMLGGRDLTTVTLKHAQELLKTK